MLKLPEDPTAMLMVAGEIDMEKSPAPTLTAIVTECVSVPLVPVTVVV